MTSKWIALLSDSSKVEEGEGDYQVIPGGRKPWIRLINDLDEKGLYLTGLGYQVDDYTTWASSGADFYSLQYNSVARVGTVLEVFHYVDFAAHFGEISKHTIRNLEDKKDIRYENLSSALRLACTPK